MSKDNLGYYDVYPYKDEPDEDEPETDPDGYVDDNDEAYDRYIDDKLTRGEL